MRLKEQRIIEAQHEHPEMYGAELARLAGVSRQYVWQVINDRGLRLVKYGAASLVCPDCAGRKSSNRKRCPACQEKALVARQGQRVTQPCAWCGKSVTRLLSKYRYQQNAPAYKGHGETVFCNRAHLGYWTAHRDGFKRTPLSLLGNDEWTTALCARYLGITPSTVYYYIHGGRLSARRIPRLDSRQGFLYAIKKQDVRELARSMT